MPLAVKMRATEQQAAVPAQELRALSEVLALIYGGSLETPPWRGALEVLRDRLGANFVFLILRPPSADENGIQVVATGGETVIEAPGYWDGGYLQSPFVNLQKNLVVTVDELIGAAAWERGVFYRQFVAQANIRYMLGADIRSDEGVECQLRVGRPPGSGDFGAAEKSLCQMLLPHLARAVRLHARLDSVACERSLFSSTVDQMLIGTVILDERGQLMKMNSAAQAILAEKDGLDCVRGALNTSYFSEENRELQRLIARAISSIAHSEQSVLEAVSVTRPSGRQKLGVLVRAIPIGEWSEGQHRPAVAVFIRDPERRASASHEMARKLFELTPAEASLAQRLANGLSLDEAADELGIRKNTARAQLRSIFIKTGVTSQSALVRTLLNSVMYLQ